MLKNWDAIIHKLCEEVSTHDVLEIVTKHVEIYANELRINKMDDEKVVEALEHLKKALILLNPEG
jgi:septum formation topological specificity factor MinE